MGRGQSGADDILYGGDIASLPADSNPEYVPHFASDGEADDYAWERAQKLFSLLHGKTVQSGTLRPEREGTIILDTDIPLVIADPHEQFGEEWFTFFLQDNSEGHPVFCLKAYDYDEEEVRVVYQGNSLTQMCFRGQNRALQAGLFLETPSVYEIIVSLQRMLQKAERSN